MSSSKREPQLTSREFDEMRVPLSSMAPQTDELVPLITGPRKGKNVYKAGEFIRSISSRTNCLPIFNTKYANPNGEINQKGRDFFQQNIPETLYPPGTRPTTGSWSVTYPVSPGELTLRRKIIRSIGRALVFLIAIRAPHTLIIIRTPDGTNYSAGFGYSGRVDSQEVPELKRYHATASDLQSKWYTPAIDSARSVLPTAISSKTIDHLPKYPAKALKPLRGAIYTADYMTPQKTHEARIIWIGILTQDIVTRLSDTITTARDVEIEGEYGDISNTYRHTDKTCGISTVAPSKNVVCMDCMCPTCKALSAADRIIARNERVCNDCRAISGRRMVWEDNGDENIISLLNMTIRVDSVYLEAAGHIKSTQAKIYNCFEWAKEILGIPHLNCGFKGDPFNCTQVTDKEIGDIMDLYGEQNPSVGLHIARLQEKLSKPGCLSKMASSCKGCCSWFTKTKKSHGGRRRKINKKYTKRRRLHSRRRRSIGKKQIK
jgi:hypothetical protein